MKGYPEEKPCQWVIMRECCDLVTKSEILHVMDGNDWYRFIEYRNAPEIFRLSSDEGKILSNIYSISHLIELRSPLTQTGALHIRYVQTTLPYQNRLFLLHEVVNNNLIK